MIFAVSQYLAVLNSQKQPFVCRDTTEKADMTDNNEMYSVFFSIFHAVPYLLSKILFFHKISAMMAVTSVSVQSTAKAVPSAPFHEING